MDVAVAAEWWHFTFWLVHTSQHVCASCWKLQATNDSWNRVDYPSHTLGNEKSGNLRKHMNWKKKCCKKHVIPDLKCIPLRVLVDSMSKTLGDSLLSLNELSCRLEILTSSPPKSWEVCISGLELHVFYNTFFFEFMFFLGFPDFSLPKVCEG